MKCPNCGQWNRASLPRCQKCGQPLEDEQTRSPAWKVTLSDDVRGKEYIRVDEDGDASRAPDARDQLAREMAELKQRKQEGARHQRQLRQDSAERGSAPSGMTIRTHASADTFWSVEDNPRATVRIRRDGNPVQEDPEVSQTHRIVRTEWDDSRSYDPLWEETEFYGAWQPPQST